MLSVKTLAQNGLEGVVGYEIIFGEIASGCGVACEALFSWAVQLFSN